MPDLVYPPVIVLVKTFWRYLGFNFDFQGQDHVPRKGGAILAINHTSYLDFALAGTAALPAKRYVRFMAKKAALRALKSGEIIGIFPEGTISTSFEIKGLKSGAVRLAIGAGVPVVPTIVWGGQRVYTKGVKPTFKRNKIPVSVSFGEPITYTRETDIEVAEVHLREVMIQMLRDVQEKYPDSHVGQRWAPVRLGGTAPAPLN